MAKRKGSDAPSRLSGSKATRRRFLGAATAGGVAAWSGLTIFSRTAHAAGRMRVLCWPGYDEKPVVGEFEEKNRVKVEFKNYIGGEQMLQFYAQSPKGTFDAIISDAEYVQKFVAQKALDAAEHGGLPESRRLSTRSIATSRRCARRTARPGASPRASASTASPTTPST